MRLGACLLDPARFTRHLCVAAGPPLRELFHALILACQRHHLAMPSVLAIKHTCGRYPGRSSPLG